LKGTHIEETSWFTKYKGSAENFVPLLKILSCLKCPSMTHPKHHKKLWHSIMVNVMN